MAVTAKWTSQIVFLHTPEFRARLDALAEKRQVSAAEVMREICDAGIDAVEAAAQ